MPRSSRCCARAAARAWQPALTRPASKRDLSLSRCWECWRRKSPSVWRVPWRSHPRNTKHGMRQTMSKDEFEPRIVAFLCNWCTYTGADLAGTSRLQYPPNVRIIRTMCSGAVDPVYVLKPLMDGVDGVLIGGCHPGDCHYQTGNYKTRRRYVALREILKAAGFDDRRVWLRWISASEGQKFAETVTEMVKAIKALGPNPMREAWVA